MRRPIRSAFERVMARTVRTEACLVFTGARDRWGYGSVRVREDGRWVMRSAHRIVFAHINGPIPSGLVVRHACDNPACVRPEHLSLGTQWDNVMDMRERGRGRSVSDRNRAKTHCPQGHPYSGDNLRTDSKGKRYCRACAPEKHRRYRARKSEGVKP